MRQSATITMSRPVLEQLKEVAQREKRTLSQQLELLVEQHFGIPQKPQSAARKKGRAAK